MQYKIESGSIDAYVKREVIRATKIMAYVFGAFIFVILLMSLKTGFYLMLIFIPLLFIFVGLMVIVSMNINVANRAKSQIFIIDDTQVACYLDNASLNLMNKIGAARNEVRYGSKTDIAIPYDKIEGTDIKKHEILIRSVEYNFLNGNGAVKLPKEMEEFEVIKAHILNNSSKFKIS